MDAGSAARSVSFGGREQSSGSSQRGVLIGGKSVATPRQLSCGCKGSCARGVYGDLDRFADAQQECTGILDSPLYVRDCEAGVCDPVVGKYLHANGHGEFVIGAMQRKKSMDFYSGCSGRGDVALNPVWTKSNFGIPGTLQNFTMHFAVANAIAALSG